jgi:uncharacterized repeat protein (TIGR01451 family)
LSSGLECAKGQRFDLDVGNLAPGEARTVQLVCAAKAGGDVKFAAEATAKGGMWQQQECAVTVIMPHLELRVAGPSLRYVQRKGTYTVHVANRGEVPAGNVMVNSVVPDGLRFVSASDGGYYTPTTGAVAWFLGELAPGQTRSVQFEALALKVGQYRQKVVASTERGFRLAVEREVITRVEDLSALLLEIAETEDSDSVEVGQEKGYEIFVTNAGSRPETDVKLVCVLPDKFEFKSAQGPGRFHAEGNVVLFEPLERLAPRGEVVYKLKAKAMAPGEARFKAQVTSSNLIEPVIKMKATRIYSDQP